MSSDSSQNNFSVNLTAVPSVTAVPYAPGLHDEFDSNGEDRQQSPLEAENVIVFDDFEEWLFDNGVIQPPVHTADLNSSLPIANSLNSVDDGHAPAVAVAEFFDVDVDAKAARMCEATEMGDVVNVEAIQMVDNDDVSMSEHDDLVFAEIIQDLSYGEWACEEEMKKRMAAGSSTGETPYYQESEVDNITENFTECTLADPLPTPAPLPYAIPKFSVGAPPAPPVKPNGKGIKSVATVPADERRADAIHKWTTKRREEQAQRRPSGPRQAATAKRERNKGKFAKRKINWVSITDVDPT
mmetsp:Transcript_22654/g.33118  ORF Transcript_22654/g.33118 Transcript_22654/m.33118 type:complete len:298 (+) Transcript_22654:291-1184(+)|eukprot:CAMPEP_0185024954 /NCGR_PEP_ID=MMETSP1103-20130426/8102_1 /TAXON_ID=36769 /ORGANISM="Paraphysomonas bandaiensis, Strain Caron Lab Isolate" /LENGTH=297 /DNA_ID=CAMNT_0027558053 /DNA_START=266 /DNA_END=1159 /DNA_ORIENTATION=+